MHYIKIREPGPADVLQPAQGDTPQPGPGQVLVAVKAAGVNRPDVVQRLGRYPPPAGASPVPGLEIAGEVVRVGDEVSTVNVGDAICALVTGGGYAEFCTAEAALCLPVPQGFSWSEAAAIPETFFTVWSNVFDRAGLLAGESLLVHGGSSGIGTTAIQLATSFGARVFTTAGSGEKCAACRELGAELAVNYKTEDFAEAVKQATGGSGVNVILDMVVGEYMQKNIDICASEGRIVIIGGLGGYKTEVNFLPVMAKRLQITGSTLRARDTAFKAAIASSLRQQVWPLLENGRVKPLIYRELPLDQAAAAHRLMESSAHIGKIVLITG